MKKGIIFDFDGVILDSEAIYLKSVCNYLLNEYGINTSIDEVKYIVGQSMNDIATCLKNKFAINETNESIIKKSLKYYDHLFIIDNLKPMFGVVEFIENCYKKGIIMSIASSSDYDYLFNIINHFKLNDYFKFILSGEDFIHSKPDPEIYNVAAKKMNLNKDELVIIEDSVSGIKAGKASGIYTIGFKGSIIEQDTSFADEEVYAFSEIKF